MLDLVIRQEEESDYAASEEVVRRAFEKEEFSDQTEHLLVQNLRKGESFVPELSIVALADGRLVGHILFTEISIGKHRQAGKWLALAPVSVLPELQNQGVGSRLIQFGHHCAESLGYQAIHVIGHEDYYPKFGYEIAAKYGITLKFEVPEVNSMIYEVVAGALNGVSGEIHYPAPFGL